MAVQMIIVSLLFVVLSTQAQYWSIPCRTVEQCAVFMDSTQHYICSEGFCFCANHTSPAQYELCIQKDTMVGSVAPGLRRNCTTHDDCSAINGANCLPKDESKPEKICLCNMKMVESADGQRCLPAAEKLGDVCLEEAQCSRLLQEGAECFEDHCRCRSTHHEGKNERCVRNLGYGESCKLEEDGCYQTSAPNEDNLLTCSEQYGCRCKKQWTYNTVSQHCEFSGASQIIVQLSTMFLLIFIVAFF